MTAPLPFRQGGPDKGNGHPLRNDRFMATSSITGFLRRVPNACRSISCRADLKEVSCPPNPVTNILYAGGCFVNTPTCKQIVNSVRHIRE